MSVIVIAGLSAALLLIILQYNDGFFTIYKGFRIVIRCPQLPSVVSQAVLLERLAGMSPIGKFFSTLMGCTICLGCWVSLAMCLPLQGQMQFNFIQTWGAAYAVAITIKTVFVYYDSLNIG